MDCLYWANALLKSRALWLSLEAMTGHSVHQSLSYVGKRSQNHYVEVMMTLVVIAYGAYLSVTFR